ncbi:hypothetical protein ACFYNL_31205 [Streptomyces sp. NPDC007808]|uniref:hypothetical protein n=1 Tax=Streptomyces sp. NPDC007808 TaxID=3364779 RepID=UPI0036751635
MGEQQSGGGSTGRRRVHPDGRVFGPGAALALDEAELEALLAAAVLRGHRPDAEGEQRAVAAFRAARAAGASSQARTRRRDDWRPREQRRLARSVKTLLSLFAVSLTLGGVAVAAIGSADAPDTSAGDRGRAASSSGAPDRPAAGHSAGASDAGKPGHPSTAQDTEAKCRAYSEVEERGNALDAAAWERLVSAAGGADKVKAYCAEQLAAAKTGPSKAPDGSGTAQNGQDRGGEQDRGDGQAPGEGVQKSPENPSGGDAGQNPENSSEQSSEGGSQQNSQQNSERKG